MITFLIYSDYYLSEEKTDDTLYLTFVLDINIYTKVSEKIKINFKIFILVSFIPFGTSLDYKFFKALDSGMAFFA